MEGPRGGSNGGYKTRTESNEQSGRVAELEFQIQLFIFVLDLVIFISN